MLTRSFGWSVVAEGSQTTDSLIDASALCDCCNRNLLKTDAQRSSDSLLLGSGGSGLLYNFNTLCCSLNDLADGIRSSLSMDHDRKTLEIS